MALTFPNRSRSYDTAHQRVRFLGYDGLFEVPFFIEAAAFSNAGSNMDSVEEDYLAAFDAARGTILDVARQVYSYGRKNMYVLTPADFERGN
ncbi:DUF1488 domain-containing protein [Phyllobacterium brassicacearum]|uniref:DUF1488 domain-containing protein n=1 Tax=Phyllobacterium brassicacearum TaxID=314235 RepID=A0A2P7BUW6_9HYPH|nr:DUF1488 domain-containing protein [Phyllobacterium brassicacearum]PSH70264.1 DUF1488 domain-containing protein [Phyllobacterium brassicacearum]TDQ33840.1 uncharacterized protein DUF1488 [Phyllobacterium brassicacearum]